MPFPVIAAIGLGISAIGARDAIRRNQINQNVMRRLNEQAEKDRLAIDAAKVKAQTLLEQDRQLPFVQSIPSKANNSYSTPNVIASIGGKEITTNELIIGAVAVIVGFLFIKSL